MAYLLDKNTAEYSKDWMNAMWCNGDFNCQNLVVPQWSGKGAHLWSPHPMGSSPRPTIPSEQTWMSTIICPMVDSWVIWLLLPPSPWFCRGQWPPESGCWWWLVVGHSPWGSSFLSVWAISVKPSGGHRGWELDGGWCSPDSCGGVASASIAEVACVAVATGLPSLQVTIIGCLRWALVLWVWCFWGSWGGHVMVSINCGEITSI